MRVGYVLKRFPRLSQTFVLEEMLELERRGVEIVVLAGRGSDEPVQHPRVALLRASVHVLAPDAAPRDVAELLAAERVDHVHAHFATWAAEVARRASRIAGVPYSFTAHATDIYRQDIDEAALAERMHEARFVVTVTDHNREHLLRVVNRHGMSGRVVRLYNGVDVARLRRDDSLRRGDLVVGVGRLVEKKGFDDLVRAAELLRDAGRPLPVVLVGEGPERRRLEAMRDERRLARLVRLAGACDQESVLDLLRRAAVLVLPCVVTPDGDRDALPTVVLEAMAVGAPVVSTRVSGIPEMVEDGASGLLVEQRDPGGLAAAVRRVIDDPTLARTFADAAREHVERHFSLTDNVAGLERLFRGEVAP